MGWREAVECGTRVWSLVLGVVAAVSSTLGWGVCRTADRLCREGLGDRFLVFNHFKTGLGDVLEGPSWVGPVLFIFAFASAILSAVSWAVDHWEESLSPAVVYVVPNLSLALRFQTSTCGGFLACFYGLGYYHAVGWDKSLDWIHTEPVDILGWVVAGLALFAITPAVILELLIGAFPEYKDDDTQCSLPSPPVSATQSTLLPTSATLSLPLNSAPTQSAAPKDTRIRSSDKAASSSPHKSSSHFPSHNAQLSPINTNTSMPKDAIIKSSNPSTTSHSTENTFSSDSTTTTTLPVSQTS